MFRRPFRKVTFRLQLLREMRFFLQKQFYFNKSLENGKFPNFLKLTNTTLVFKKGARNSKYNYRPVSILPVFSKILERLLSWQLLEFFDKILNFNMVLERAIEFNITYY